MFKVLILQAMHALPDERCEYLIKDRLSFMRFLGLGLVDPVPDANTIWTFREALKKAGAVDSLFQRFDEALRSEGFFGDERPDRRRHDRGGAQAAQHDRGEESDQGRPDA
jgi:IS5 family transposase